MLGPLQPLHACTVEHLSMFYYYFLSSYIYLYRSMYLHCESHKLYSEMELELGLALPNNRKRGFEDDHMKTTLPLFVWKGGDDDSGDNGYLINKEDEWSGKELVGWPPVKYGRWIDDRRNAKCVKVKMEGVGIGRKVNLSLHHCYESMLHTLKDMFFPYHHHNVGVDGFDEQRVTYEDGEGDWWLVGDVPWEIFLQSVKSIKILARRAD